MKIFTVMLVVAALVSPLLAQSPARACSGDKYKALQRADIVFVGEFVAVGSGQELGRPTTFARAEVHYYLKGSGPATLEFTENAANQCATGISSENVGDIVVLGLDRDDRGRLTIPWFAIAPMQFEGAVIRRLAEAGHTPPEGTGIEEAPASEAIRPAHMLGLFAVLTAAGATRLVTRS